MQSEQKNIEQLAIEIHLFFNTNLKNKKSKKTKLYFNYLNLDVNLFLNLDSCTLMTNRNNTFYYYYIYCKNYHFYYFTSLEFTLSELKNF